VIDHNVADAAQHFSAEEAAHEHACYRAAQANGLTPEQADECDDGDKGCPACPFKRTRAKEVQP
jgi:hypothetical protein